MDLLTENQPETCASLGMECGACVRQAASSVAAVCHGLEPAALHQVFFQLFPSPGCKPMALAFTTAYREVGEPQRQILALATAAA